jgi:hypothetical protein
VTDSWFKSLTQRWRGAPADPAAQARQARVQRFRAEVRQALTAGDRASLEAVARLPAELDLPDDEVELEQEMVQGALDALDLKDRIGRDGLPDLAHQHKALGDDRCHFLASVFLADDDGHRTGRLFFTNRRLLFLAAPILTVPWSRVAVLTDDARDLVVQTVGRGEVYRFRCNSFADARCGMVIAQALLPRGRDSSETPARDPRAAR